MPYMQSNWTAHLALSVKGGAPQDWGYWKAKEGGGLEVEEANYPDWDGDVQLGGKRSRAEITMRKLYREGVHKTYHTLDALGGRADFTLTLSPTDDDGVSWGDPIVMTGKLGNVSPPDVDKGSSDGGEIEVTVRPNVALA